MNYICDFCSSPEVSARYSAHDFVAGKLQGTIYMSVGCWAACSLCEKLIDTANWETLLQNAVNSFYQNCPGAQELIPVPDMTAHIETMWTELRRSNLRKASHV